MPEVEYLKCLFCGYTKPIRTGGGVFRLKEMEIPPSEFQIIQVRDVLPGPGRGRRIKGEEHGFKVTRGYSMAEAVENPEYRDLALSLKSRLLQIVEDYVKAGIIRKSELRRLLSAR